MTQAIWYYYKQIIRYFILRLELVSEISKDIAQVFFAVLAIEAFTKDIINWNLVMSGLLLSTLMWGMSIISFKVKKYGP